MTVLESFDDPHLPERLVAIELLRHDAPDQVAQLPVEARSGERGVPEVVPEVEVRIVDPHRPAELKRHEPNLLPVARHRGQLARDHPREVLGRGWWTLEDGDRPDVHVAHRVFDVEKRCVERAHSVHESPPLVQRLGA